MIYIPILGAIALAFGTILQKVILKKKNISFKRYLSLEFLSIVLIMLTFVWFFWKMEAQALVLKNIIIFIIVIIFSIIANLFTFYSLKGEKLNRLEPAKILEPLFVVALAIVFSFFVEGLYERNLKIIIPTLIAALALFVTHIEKKHLHFNKYFIAAIIGSLFFALELVTSRLILHFYSPVTFYFLRSSAILLLSFFIFRPNVTNLKKQTQIQILLVGAIWVTFRVIVYYGYLHLGIIFTTLILMLGPILIYAFAKLFLKEKLHWKNILASVIILACVLYATLV